MSTIPVERVMELLEIENETVLYQDKYKNKFKRTKDGFDYKDVMDYISITNARNLFLCEVQRLVIFIIDESNQTKTKIAKNLGFTNSANMDSFLETITHSKKTAAVFVKACKNYRGLVREYDIYMGYVK